MRQRWSRLDAHAVVSKRLQTLQVGQPFPLYLLASVSVEEDMHRVEKQVHAFLAEERHRGEWFAVPMDTARLTALVTQALKCVTEEEARRVPEAVCKADAQLLSEPWLHIFVERLCHAREKRGWTQTERGRRSGVHHMAISRLERGDKKNVTGITLRKLALALGVSTDWLLGIEDDDEQEPALAV